LSGTFHRIITVNREDKSITVTGLSRCAQRLCEIPTVFSIHTEVKLRRRRLRAGRGQAHKDDRTPNRKCSNTIFGLIEAAMKPASFIETQLHYCTLMTSENQLDMFNILCIKCIRLGHAF
jgi:hypothetical protein